MAIKSFDLLDTRFKLKSMTKHILLLLLLATIPYFGQAQEEILLDNPSFEDYPHAGTSGTKIRGWQDCGAIYFESETPPDIHMGQAADARGNDVYFGVKQPASHGFSFLGFVVRDNETYESVSQRLSQPLKGGTCYSFSIDLSRSMTYISPYPPRQNSKKYTRPVVLRIYGGTSYCGKRELLAESVPIENEGWLTYEFKFEPSMDHRYISLSGYYKVPVTLPYNGNILLDNASPIREIPCPEEAEEEPELSEEKPVVAEKKPKETKVKRTPKKAVEVAVQPAKKESRVAEANKPKEAVKPPKITINKELDRTTLKEGQTIKIKNLFFDADSIVVNEKSMPALEELASFLQYNKDIRIEIGGHTNGRPTHNFCDRLSRERAKSVAQYLYDKNIPEHQVFYKGYGKRRPIATNQTREGRRRNQRVEIKVLSIGR